jgi:hypothetical protein
MLAEFDKLCSQLNSKWRCAMATATARNVDDNDYSIIAASANKNGRSISEEFRLLIASHARKLRAEQTVSALRELREKSNWTLPNGMTSLDLLRGERDSWRSLSMRVSR